MMQPDPTMMQQGGAAPAPVGGGHGDMIAQALMQNLTPQELAELDQFIQPRFAQLLAKALPELGPVLQIFIGSQVGGEDPSAVGQPPQPANLRSIGM